MAEMKCPDCGTYMRFDVDEGKFCCRICHTSISLKGVSADRMCEAADEYLKAGCHSDSENWYKKSAKAGYVRAWLELGRMYLDGNEDISKNIKKAKKYFESAIKSGSVDAQYMLGRLYEQEGALSSALMHYEGAAALGCTDAMRRLASYHSAEAEVPDHAKAMGWYAKLAEQDDGEAAYLMAKYYEEGKHTKKDPAKAQKYYTRAAKYGYDKAISHNSRSLEQSKTAPSKSQLFQIEREYKLAASKGSAEAMYELGKIYENGNAAIPKNLDRAIEQYRLAKENGDARAASALERNRGYIEKIENEKKAKQEAEMAKLVSEGDKLWREKKYTEAARLYGNAARGGCVTGMYSCGYCFEYGCGVTQSDRDAFSWYKCAANQGKYALAQMKVGVFIRDRRGGANTVYPRTAVPKYLSAAADGGCAEAWYHLGDCYLRGECVEQSDHDAAVCFSVGAKRGNAACEGMLGICLMNGIGKEQDVAEGVRLITKSADAGDVNANAELGCMLYNGNAVKQDICAAAKRFLFAAERGSVSAQFHYGICLFNGTGVSKNMSLAAKWYENSAEAGYAPAQHEIACCYYYGDGVAKNMRTAEKWFRRAAEGGYAMSYFCYAYMLDLGLGEYHSHKEALKWYELAANAGSATAPYNMALIYLSGEQVSVNRPLAIKYLNEASRLGEREADELLQRIKMEEMLDELELHTSRLEKQMARELEWQRKQAELEAWDRNRKLAASITEDRWRLENELRKYL